MRTGLIKKQVVDKNGHLRTVWVRPKGNIGILRRDMPQITSANRDDYMGWLKKKGVSYKHETVDPKELKATQKEMDENRVERLNTQSGMNYMKSKRIFISKDGHVLDGHHAWEFVRRKGLMLKVTRIDLPIKKLLKLTAKYPKVEKRGISAPLPKA